MNVQLKKVFDELTAIITAKLEEESYEDQANVYGSLVDWTRDQWAEAEEKAEEEEEDDDNEEDDNLDASENEGELDEEIPDEDESDEAEGRVRVKCTYNEDGQELTETMGIEADRRSNASIDLAVRQVYESWNSSIRGTEKPRTLIRWEIEPN